MDITNLQRIEADKYNTTVLTLIRIKEALLELFLNNTVRSFWTGITWSLSLISMACPPSHRILLADQEGLLDVALCTGEGTHFLPRGQFIGIVVLPATRQVAPFSGHQPTAVRR